MNTTIQPYRIEHAFDGRFYPMFLDGPEYEYFWTEEGDEVSFASEVEASTYIASAPRYGC